MQPGAGPHPYRRRLRADSTFFLELQFCDAHGLPHSQFLAWEPVDRAKALAFSMEKALRCVMCGTAAWEWDESRHAYEAVEKFCPGCYAKDYLAEDAGRRPGVTVELAPSTGIEAARRQLSAERMDRQRSAQAVVAGP